MNVTDDLERQLRSMLADAAPRREPETLFAAVMASSRTVRQRPGVVVDLRRGGVPATGRSAVRFAPAVLVGLLLTGVVGMLGLFGGGSTTPVAPSPSPTPSPSIPSPSVNVAPQILDGEPWIVYMSGVSAGLEGTFLIRPDGTDAHRIAAEVPGSQKHPDWSPDGTRIVFVVEDTGAIWIVDADGSNAELVLDCPDDCDYPAWSPDGSKLAFTEYENDAPPTQAPRASSIKIIDLATKTVTTVVREERPLLVDVPRWSPDGTDLVVGVDRMDDAGNETGAAIAIVPAAGGKLRYLTEFASYAYKPDWSWVTDTILYGTDVLKFKLPQVTGDETWNLFTIKPDGTGVKQITDVPFGSRLWEASWTPDGTQVIADWESNRVGVFVDPVTGTITTISGTTVMTHPVLRPIP